MIKHVSAIAGFGMIVSIFTPVVFAETVDINGNGDGSTNVVVVVDGGQSIAPNITQQSITEVTSTTVVGTNTGNNTVTGTTQSGAGDQTTGVSTGGVEVTVTSLVTGGDNTITSTNSCGCEPTVTDVTISGNGVRSRNTVLVQSAASGSLGIRQRNTLGAGLGTIVGTNTGNNRVRRTTQSGEGSGATGVLTGNAVVTVTNRVVAGGNSASL